MTTVNATSGHNLFVVREASSKTLLDGKLVLKLRRIFGYAIEIKANDRILKLAVGEILPIEDTACRLKFHEIATETRLAKFSVDCEG